MATERVVLEAPEKLRRKWRPVINCERDELKPVKESMPPVKAKHELLLATELEQTSQLVLEASQSGDVARFSPILIPMLRRITPSLLSTEIFGVQPLTTPTGLIYCLRAVYAGMDGANSVKRAVSQIIVLSSEGTNDGFTVGKDIASEDGVTAKIIFREANTLLVKITSNDGADRFAVSDKLDSASTYSAEETSIVSQTDNEALYKFVFKSYTGDPANVGLGRALGLSTADAELLSTDMKEIGVTVESTTATAVERKLKANFTVELVDDLLSQHGMDAYALFSEIGSEEIVVELNREAIDYINAKAMTNPDGTTTWNYATADGRWEIEKYQNLAAKVSRVSRDIAKTTRRGQGNFIIVDTTTLTALELSGRLDTTGVDPVGSSYVGMFNGYIKVFVDLFEENSQILMGYKGNSETDAGVFYSPYIPLKIVIVNNADSGQPRMFFRTRYALTDNPYGASNYFRKIEIENLPG